MTQQPRSSKTASMDPLAARKEARRRRRRRRHILRVTIVVAALAFIGFLIYLAFPNSLLSVKAIEVVGDTRYTAEEIIAASGITQGESLLSLNKTEAHNAILDRFPYLDTVKVTNSSFTTVCIEVQESTVMALVETTNGHLVLGENNRALERVTDPATLPTGIVCIRGATFQEETVGKPLLDERSLRVVTTLCGAAKQEGIHDLTLIDLSEKTNIRLMWRQQIQVILGNESNLAAQIKALANTLPTLLNNNGESATGRLDMTSFADGKADNDRSVFSPKPLEELLGKPAEEPAEPQEPTDDATDEETPAEPQEPSTDTAAPQ
ncbi:MAG: FtsQ-type POTRA domain-containing protein [Ruminococcaceae bacterium]|nr:FtsQ-type POTRA domain-containing protein [Oscillospiraceae bacterium]